MEEDEPFINEDDLMMNERSFQMEEENENDVNTANHLITHSTTDNQITPGTNHQTTPILTPFFSFYQRQSTEMSSRGNIYNTNTIIMFAISIAYQGAQNPTARARVLTWMMAGALILFLFVQVFILLSLQVDSMYPTCTKHSDCEPGRMCDGFNTMDWWTQPRCEPCARLELLEDSCDVDVDLEDFFESSWFDSNFIANVDIKEENYSNIFGSEEDTMRCIAKQYCQNTVPFGLPGDGDGCDLIKISAEKASTSGYIVLFFMSFLFSGYLYQDMEEAEVENALLDFIISSELAGSLWIPIFIIRIMNRARRFFLPFYLVYAGAGIIVSEGVSPKNITLNLLALIFVLEADNLLALLVISESRQQEASNLVEAAKRNHVSIGQAEITRDAALVSVLMFVVCLMIDLLMEVSGCDIGDTTAEVFVYGQPVFTIYKFVGNLVFSEKPKKFVRAVLVFLWMWIGAWVMGMMANLSVFTVTPMVFTDYPPIPMIVIIISSSCVVFRPRQMLVDSYVNSWGNIFINILITLAWVAAQGWSLYSFLFS